jgi:hypothetical protein
MRKAVSIAIAVLLASLAAARADFQGSTHLMPFDDETINYNKKEPSGAIAKLQERINQGKVSLKYEPGFGYVRSLLDELKVPKSSQMLVFSKTSLQRERISPRNPRAIFFNDDIYIGFIPGAPLVEISVADPKLGAVFYTLEQTKKDKPRFVRTDQCLECHASAKSMGVPGHLVRSFATDETGMVDVNSGTSLVDHRTPLAERWGGWYVTGKHGNQTHRGNLVGKEAFERQEKEPNYLGNLESLDPFIQTSDYVAPHSDIVALMVLEHQTHMHNFITRLNYEATIRIAEYGAVKYLNSPTESFLKYLLFVEEAPLTAPVSGTSSFAKEFAAKGPKDKKGRSLRDLQLQTRLFKYPCSYLIYSEAFDALPAQLKENIYQRLWNILNGKDSDPEFQKIPAETRRAILEILVDTKKNLPAYWKLEAQASAARP